MLKVKEKFTSTLEQYLIMPSTPTIYYNFTPIVAYLDLRNLINCILLPKHGIFPYYMQPQI